MTEQTNNLLIVGSNINTIINNGIDPEQTKILVHDLFLDNFPKMREVAKEEADINIAKFAELLAEKFQLLTIDNIRIGSSPDFQFDLSNAIRYAARFDKPDLNEFLADLLSKKLEGKLTESGNLILSECINVIGKLTKNQLDILTFTFMMMEYPHKVKFETWEDYNVYFNENVRPFMYFNNAKIDFKHLEYAGCSRFDSGYDSPRLSTILKQQMKSAFQGTSELTKDVWESEKIVADNFPDATNVEEIILDADIWGTATTSVGIMLASIYYEKIIGRKLTNLDLFFNY